MFSGPNATLSAARSKTVCASGSCSTRPQRPIDSVGGFPSIRMLPSLMPPSSSGRASGDAARRPCSPLSSAPALHDVPKSPAVACRIVDFPMPEAPIRSTRSPASMVRLRWRTAHCQRRAGRYPQSENTIEQGCAMVPNPRADSGCCDICRQPHCWPPTQKTYHSASAADVLSCPSCTFIRTACPDGKRSKAPVFAIAR